MSTIPQSLLFKQSAPGSAAAERAEPASGPGSPAAADATSFEATLSAQLGESERAQAAHPPPLAAQSLASQASPQNSFASQLSVFKASSRESGAPSGAGRSQAPADETPAPSDAPADAKSAARVASEQALDALALNERAAAQSGASSAEKSGAKSPAPAKGGPEKTAAPARDAGSEIAQALAQSGPEQSAGASKSAAGEVGKSASAASVEAGGEHAAANRKLATAAQKPAPEAATGSAKTPANASAPTPSAASAPDASALKPGAAAAARAVPFAQEADADPSLHVALLPQAAHLRMDLGGAGDLDLHLRLLQGEAHVTVSGSAAPLVDARSSDLRSSLASQGLSLGSLEHVAPTAAPESGSAGSQDFSQSSSGRDQPDADDRSKPAPSAALRAQAAFTISRSSASQRPALEPVHSLPKET